MKRWKWLCIIVIVCSLAGCWDRKEINEVSIVSGITLEKETSGDITLTVEVVNSPELSQQAEGFTPVITYSDTGKTMSELLNKMNKGLARNLVFSHLQTVIIDENLAREGIGPYLQYIEKDARFRSDFILLVSKGVKASDVVKTAYPVHKVPSLKLFNQFETVKERWGDFPILL
ncbi:hypothetical protein [Bacillus sp. JCM 19034]|uniref:Ger(x)C family spore germination protein n=1 Tax=Bacillus sp. JCM 19034 TaxID=1481928 RepID=UPI0007822DD5|nr:hypothetical protein [Bacillus sp. JCM 19034]